MTDSGSKPIHPAPMAMPERHLTPLPGQIAG
jgi:hypothetical protein